MTEPVRDVLARRRGEILRLARAHHARDVRLFGSVARGTSTQDSDVDILVTFDAEATLLDQIALEQDLEDLLGLKVDVVSVGGLSPYVREQVLREAVPV